MKQDEGTKHAIEVGQRNPRMLIWKWPKGVTAKKIPHHFDQNYLTMGFDKQRGRIDLILCKTSSSLWFCIIYK